MDTTTGVASTVRTAVDFDIPNGACDCHVHVFDPSALPLRQRTDLHTAKSVARMIYGTCRRRSASIGSSLSRQAFMGSTMPAQSTQSVNSAHAHEALSSSANR